MWCLDTIVMLNDAAQRRAEKQQSIRHAYSDVNISIPIGRILYDGEKSTKKSSRERSSNRGR